VRFDDLSWAEQHLLLKEYARKYERKGYSRGSMRGHDWKHFRRWFRKVRKQSSRQNLTLAELLHRRARARKIEEIEHAAVDEFMTRIGPLHYMLRLGGPLPWQEGRPRRYKALVQGIRRFRTWDVDVAWNFQGLPAIGSVIEAPWSSIWPWRCSRWDVKLYSTLAAAAEGKIASTRAQVENMKAQARPDSVVALWQGRSTEWEKLLAFLKSGEDDRKIVEPLDSRNSRTVIRPPLQVGDLIRATRWRGDSTGVVTKVDRVSCRFLGENGTIQAASWKEVTLLQRKGAA